MNLPQSVALAAALAGIPLTAKAGGKTVEDRNKEVVLRFEDEFKNKANLDIVLETDAPDFVAHGLAPQPLTREMLKGLGAAVFAAFPDVKATIDDVVAAGDRVVTRVTIHATNKGAFNGIPATNKPVVWTEMHMYRLKDGKIAEQWSNVDFLGLLTQLGAIPPPPAAAAKK